MPNPDPADALAVKGYLNELQDRITAAVEKIDSQKFRRDAWTRPEGGGGESRVLSEGAVFERAGVSVSHVSGDKMPASASNQRPEIAGAPFEAMGLSLVFHPRNPYAPTTHCNVRFFIARPAGGPEVWWFGGGFDLTPYYPFDEDVLHWHRCARDACRAIRTGRLPEIQGLVRPLFFSAASKRDPRCRRLVLRRFQRRRTSAAASHSNAASAITFCPPSCRSCNGARTNPTAIASGNSNCTGAADMWNSTWCWTGAPCSDCSRAAAPSPS